MLMMMPSLDVKSTLSIVLQKSLVDCSVLCTTALCLMRLWHGLFMPDYFRDNRSYPVKWATFTPDCQH
jgi:hypothetical protein